MWPANWVLTMLEIETRDLIIGLADRRYWIRIDNAGTWS